MTIKDILNKFEQEERDLTLIRHKNVNSAQNWLNNEGLGLMRAFKNEVFNNRPWQCEVEVEQFGQHTGNRFAKIHIYQINTDYLNHQTNQIKNIYITIHHKNENEEEFIVTLSDGKSVLNSSQKIKSSNITIEFLGEQLSVALNKFILEPLK